MVDLKGTQAHFVLYDQFGTIGVIIANNVFVIDGWIRGFYVALVPK